MSAVSAETYARSVPGLPKIEDKLDTISRAIVQLAIAIQLIEREVDIIWRADRVRHNSPLALDC